MSELSFLELLRIKKPGQYIDSEYNSVKKEDAYVKAVLIYPDLYEVGQPNLGLQILYSLGNQLEWALVDRAFAPDRDMAEKILSGKTFLKGLETGMPLKDFDLIGFTLQSELTYTTLLFILELAGLPLFSEERGEEFPIVVAGGPGAFNPFPLHKFVDVFIVGDGEEPFLKTLEIFRSSKREDLSKQAVLERIDFEIESAFVPSFYRFDAGDDGRTVKGFIKIAGNLSKTSVKRSICRDITPYVLEKQLVPNVSVAHERAQLEIARGCRRGCRFCQAGFIYRPVREANIESLSQHAKNLLLNTGYEELGFVTLSASDYSLLEELLREIYPFCEERKITISLPSLRMDSFSVKLANSVSTGRKTTLTFAPEAGTERLRAVINKNLSDAEVEEALTSAFHAGYQKIKLYFMIGLPLEEREDLEGIAEIVDKAYALGRKLLPQKLKSRLRVNVSVSTFIPKPHTPFQWEAQIEPEEAGKKADILRSLLKHHRSLKLSFHNHYQAAVEGLISRGGPQSSEIIYKAYKNGAVFDGWEDRFSFEVWEAASNGVSKYLKELPEDALLPWEIIDSGIKKSFLLNERKKAYQVAQSPACFKGCVRCGVCSIVPLREAGE